MEWLARQGQAIPAQYLQFDYAVSCEIPDQFSEAVMEEARRRIETECGVFVERIGQFAGRPGLTTFTITGNVPQVYAGHMLLMRKLYEMQRRDQGRQGGPIGKGGGDFRALPLDRRGPRGLLPVCVGGYLWQMTFYP